MMANGAAKKCLPAPRWVGPMLMVGTVIMGGLVLWCYLATRDVPLFRKYFEGDLVPRNMGMFEVVFWLLLYLPVVTLLSAGLVGELRRRPGLAGRLLATEDRVVKMITYRALELLKESPKSNE